VRIPGDGRFRQTTGGEDAAATTHSSLELRPQHMVALKLHASRSSDRDPQKAGQDWLDIRKLIELHGLDPNEGTFASLIRRYGGDEALERIRQMCQN
jgi:hypothetical protein